VASTPYSAAAELTSSLPSDSEEPAATGCQWGCALKRPSFAGAKCPLPPGAVVSKHGGFGSGITQRNRRPWETTKDPSNSLRRGSFRSARRRCFRASDVGNEGDKRAEGRRWRTCPMSPARSGWEHRSTRSGSTRAIVEITVEFDEGEEVLTPKIHDEVRLSRLHEVRIAPVRYP
jgi:hypothetical protein